MNRSYKVLPPDGLLAIPTSSRAAARAGLMMYTACRPRPLLAQRLAWAFVSALGPRWLPTRSQPFEDPTAGESWAELCQRWTGTLGSFDDVAVHLRRPSNRRGASLILLDQGRPIAFVKVRPDRGDALDVEAAALGAFGGRSAPFEVARVLDRGRVGRWHYLAMSPLPVRIHTIPAGVDLIDVATAVSQVLESAWTRPSDVPVEWLPMHGDFTPWNLRSSGESLLLYDWERATWAPPGADIVWWDSAIEVLDLDVAPTGATHPPAAVAYWIERLAREVDPEERDLRGFVFRRLRDRG